VYYKLSLSACTQNWLTLAPTSDLMVNIFNNTIVEVRLIIDDSIPLGVTREIIV